MAYASWSVIAGETPTATKWNILGTNDLFFDAEVTKLYQAKKSIVTITDGATVTVDGNAASAIQQVTIAGNRALAISNMAVGQGIFLRIIQGTGGSRLITSWFAGSTVLFPGGSGAPTLSTAVGAIDGFLILCTASGVYEVYFGGFGMA